MIDDQNFYNTFFMIFYPTASATAYGQRPKFFRAEHSATAKGENCTYGPTLSFGHNFLFGYTIAPKNQLLMIKVGQLHIPNIKILGYFGKWVVQSKNFRFENSKFVLYFTC